MQAIETCTKEGNWKYVFTIVLSRVGVGIEIFAYSECSLQVIYHLNVVIKSIMIHVMLRHLQHIYTIPLGDLVLHDLHLELPYENCFRILCIDR